LPDIARHWDAKAVAWDHELRDPTCHLNEDDAYERFLSEAARLIAARRGFCARSGVVDAACGTGLVLARVIGAFGWGIGVDISPEMIRLASEKHLSAARFVVGDCFRLPALCPKAGVVFSRGVLLSHYGAHEGQALLEAARATLAPGGFLMFDFLNEAARTKHRHQPANKHYFTRGQVASMARQAGLCSPLILGEDARRVLLLVAELG
jgi:SAM-dependent methyltransferase